MSAAAPAAVGARRDSNAYSLFIFVLTVLSSDDTNGKTPLPPPSSDTESRDELRAIRRELGALRAASGRDDEPGP